jgi:type III pantothenate kinase
MIVEADLGNSRIKWRLLAEGVVVAFGCYEYANLSSWCVYQPVTRIRVSCVTSEVKRLQFIVRCQELFSIEPEFAQVSASLGGVACAYKDYKTLGIDRWLALLAAYKRCSGAAIVVDCGTAITIDLLAANGLHRGGYILPGFDLMLSSLSEDTASVQVSIHDTPMSLDLGGATSECVSHGVLMSIVSLVETVQKMEPAASLMLTGGAGASLCRYLVGAEWAESLVLDGLVVALP